MPTRTWCLIIGWMILIPVWLNIISQYFAFVALGFFIVSIILSSSKLMALIKEWRGA